MAALSRSLIQFGASFLTTRVGWRLRKHGAGPAQQHHILRGLLKQLAATQYGREHGITSGMPYARFRSTVPLRTHPQLAPYIQRMIQGESDVLWPGRCQLFAATAGTTTGKARYVPVTEVMSRHFQKAGLNALLYYASRTGHTALLSGRQLCLGGRGGLKPIPEHSGAQSGDLSAILFRRLPDWADRHFYEPGQTIANMADWKAKLAAIAERTDNRDITLLAGSCHWLPNFAETLLHRRGGAPAGPFPLKTRWPNLECLVHGGVPSAPYADELRAAVGPAVNFHEVYAAAEGFIAAQDGDQAAGLRLMTDAGLFFEFLPMREFDAALPDSLGAKAVPLEQVEPGLDYALVVTSPAGLCRYLIGDVVRFVTTRPPRLIHVGRTQLSLNAFGEGVTEKDVTDALVSVCQRHGWTITSFHLAPLFIPTVTGQIRGRHEWWVELKPLTVETPTGPVMAPELDLALQRLNSGYAARRREGVIEPPFVRLVMPGLFRSWMEETGNWGGHSKMPRCRSDRMVADALARIARFSRD